MQDLKDEGWIPGLGRAPGRGQGNPFQYSCLENPMDRGAWWATAHMVAKSRTQLKRLNTHTHTHTHIYTHTYTHTHKWGPLGWTSKPLQRANLYSDAKEKLKIGKRKERASQPGHGTHLGHRGTCSWCPHCGTCRGHRG